MEGYESNLVSRPATAHDTSTECPSRNRRGDVDVSTQKGTLYGHTDGVHEVGLGTSIRVLRETGDPNFSFSSPSFCFVTLNTNENPVPFYLRSRRDLFCEPHEFSYENKRSLFTANRYSITYYVRKTRRCQEENRSGNRQSWGSSSCTSPSLSLGLGPKVTVSKNKHPEDNYTSSPHLVPTLSNTRSQYL